MYRQIVGYIPANVVPAVVAFVMVYAYTRILTPSSFGTYNFMFSGQVIAPLPLVTLALLRLWN